MAEYPMSLVVVPSIHIYECSDADLSAYLVAGWRQASTQDLAHFAQGDPYDGEQGYPKAPPLVKPGVAPTAQLEVNTGPCHQLRLRG